MPVCVSKIRDELLPGLWEVRGMYCAIPTQWAVVFAEEAAPILPPVSLPVAVAMGAAAVLIQNPEISRRGLFAWGSE